MQADLSEANLRGADLSRTFLTAATMPNGQRYEAWLRDEERHGEDGENAALRNGPQNELRGNPISRSSHSGHSRKFAGKVEPYDPPLRTNRSMCSVETIPNQRRR
jgi:hypothetical protein